jgi:hypothetical protein
VKVLPTVEGAEALATFEGFSRIGRFLAIGKLPFFDHCRQGGALSELLEFFLPVASLLGVLVEEFVFLEGGATRVALIVFSAPSDWFMGEGFR